VNSAGLVETFGHSQNTGYLTGGPEYAWPALVAAGLGAYNANYAQNGLTLAGNANGYSNYIRPASALRGRTAPYAAAADVVIAHVGLADLANNYLNAGVYTRVPFANALRACLAFAQLGGFFGAEPAGASDATISYGGTWIDVSNVTNSGTGAGWREALGGATLTITVPADFPGGDIWLFWVVLSNGIGSGGVFDAVVTGNTQTAVRETITPADADPVTNTNYNLKATRIPGLNPGAHTVTVTARTITNLGVGFDGWGIRAPIPPALVVAQQPRLTAANYAAWLGPGAGDTPTDDAVADINQLIAGIADEFGATSPTLPPILLQPSRYTADGAHPNEVGHQIIADAILGHLRGITTCARAASAQPLPASFAANWGNDTAPYANTVLQLARPRQVRLIGRAKRTGTPSTGETILTVPEGLRPASSHAYVCPGSTATPVVTVASDGTVKYTSGTLGASGTIDLDTIAWTVGR